MAATAEATEIRPQPGPQEAFLSTPADIAIFGGSAGGGKTYALLLEPLRHVGNKDFGAVIFRRTYPQIMSEGGLWDTAGPLYSGIGARPYTSPDPEFRFPSGATVKLRHLQHEKTKYDWQGSQIPLILWDELTQFPWTLFTYLLSRNRSMCGVRPYMRATCNPDPDHWLRTFLAWWIGEDGYPIPSRAGVIRWMAVLGGTTHWADSKEELVEQFGADVEPLSVTFIPATLDDNPALMEADPGYRAKLKALPKHEREQLLGGNWDARPVAGTYFQRHWFETLDVAPVKTRWVRYWDRAATEPSENNPDPDWTVGGLVGVTPDGYYIIGDVVRLRGTPRKVEDAILKTASRDGEDVQIGLEQEPGASGKTEAQYLARKLSGYNVRVNPKRHRKEQDWSPLSSQAEAGNVAIMRGAWNHELLSELEALPEGAHDDQADAVSGAFMMLTKGVQDTRVGMPIQVK